MFVLREQYAPAYYRSGVEAVMEAAGEKTHKLHRTNPHVSGRALCSSSVELNMAGVTSEAPPAHGLCTNCRRKAANFARVYGADVGQIG